MSALVVVVSALVVGACASFYLVRVTERKLADCQLRLSRVIAAANALQELQTSYIDSLEVSNANLVNGIKKLTMSRED